MNEQLAELRVRQDIAERIARADRRRIASRVKAERRARRAGLDSV